MASGIARSKFIRAMANAVGWEIGRLRKLFKRADYHAPYTDLPRALRILQVHLPEQLPAVLKALNLDATALRAAEGVQQLTLMPPAVPAPPVPEGVTGALTPQVPPRSLDARPNLIDRLAQAIPGEESLSYKRDKVRAILKKHGVDGRFKDEVRALAWIKKIFPEAALESQETVTALEVVPELETLPPARLRELVQSLTMRLAEKDEQLKQIKTRFGEVNYFLNATKAKMVGETGLFDVNPEQALFFLALDAAKRPL